MPRDANQSEGPSTLPAPELNPLLNPVLGQHMGRWAEVYFTAPPEKREQAVLELLRELQGEPEAASATPPAFVAEPSPRMGEARRGWLRCLWCGRENPASHKFCGMCGKSVAEPAIEDLHIADLHVAERAIGDTFDVSSFERVAPLRESVLRGETPASHSVSTTEGGHEAWPDKEEEPILHRERGLERSDIDDEIFHYPPASRSYGAFLGLALVVTMLAIAYIVWHSSYGAQPAGGATQVSPPLAATQPASQPAILDPAPPSLSKPDLPEPAPPASQTYEETAPTTTSAAARENGRTDARIRGRKSASAEPVGTVAAAEKNPAPDTAAGNGSEELATAQRYLNGTDGQERDRAEAAKWLWKAVSKHNPDATLLLADLYLKGEGVSKSCDQARVLIDAAARQGIKGAGDHLRHLQAFGCQ